MERLGDYTEELRRGMAKTDFLRFAWAQAKYPPGPDGTRDIRQLDATLKGFRSTSIDVWREKAAVGAATVADTGFADLAGIAREWLVTVSPLTFMGRLRARRVPFATRVNLGTAPDAQFAGNGSALYPVRIASDSGTFLRRMTVGTIAVTTNELMQTWRPGTREALDALLTRSLVRGMDRAALDPDSAGTEGEAPASLLNGIDPLAALSSTVSTALGQIKSMIQVLIDGGSDLTDAMFATHPTVALTLATMITTEGVRAFPDVTPVGGSILGIPLAVTVSAQRSGSPSEKIFALVDGAQVALADDGEITLATSRLATLHQDDGTSQHAGTGTGTATVSMYQTDSTAIKLTRAVNWERLTDNAVAWLTAA